MRKQSPEAEKALNDLTTAIRDKSIALKVVDTIKERVSESGDRLAAIWARELRNVSIGTVLRRWAKVYRVVRIELSAIDLYFLSPQELPSPDCIRLSCHKILKDGSEGKRLFCVLFSEVMLGKVVVEGQIEKGDKIHVQTQEGRTNAAS